MLTTRRMEGSITEQLASETLPSAPSNAEKYIYAKRRLLPLTLFSLISFAAILISQLRFAAQDRSLLIFLPLILCTAVYYLVSLTLNLGTSDFDLREHIERVATWRPENYPSIDIFLPTAGESIALIRNTWEHVARIQYAGDVTMYALDDAADPAVEALADEFQFRYLVRPNRGYMKKAGNIKYGCENSSGALVVIFDADFCPRSDMLVEIAPYFDDPTIGIVQTPQHFRVLRSQGWLERGAGAVQEFFYRAVQVTRNSWGGSICCGTNALYRRASLLWNDGPTQIEHSEDVHTGFDIQGGGWRVHYVPVIYAVGACPSLKAAFVAQQYRWCFGSMSLLTSRKFWRATMPLRTRLCYISGFLHYVHTALFTLATPLIPVTLLAFYPEAVLLVNVVLLIPSIIYTMVILRLWHGHPYGLESWATKMVYGWAHLFALSDVLRGRYVAWKPTGSALASNRGSLSRRFGVGIWGWGVGSAAAWTGLAAWRMGSYNLADFAPMLLSALFYGAVVAQCLMNTHRPVAERNYIERFAPALCSASASGMAVLLLARSPL